MALFVDGPINGAEELRRYESSLLDVAGTEEIDLGGKLDLAHRETAVELTAFLVRQQELKGNQRGLGGVVITEPLAQWEALHTLALFFRDAYHNQLNDRFKGKWQEYARLAKNASVRLFEIGVGMSRAPLPVAAAPEAIAVPGGGLAAGNYYVAIAWRNPAGEQGRVSSAAEVAAEAGDRLVVTPGEPPSQATAYSVYAGSTPNEMQAQSVNVPLHTSWANPAEGLLGTVAELPQQRADYFVTKVQRLLRG